MSKLAKEIEDVRSRLRDRLLKHMLKVGMTSYGMAPRIGIALNTLKYFLSKKRSPTLSTMDKIINYLEEKEKKDG